MRAPQDEKQQIIEDQQDIDIDKNNIKKDIDDVDINAINNNDNNNASQWYYNPQNWIRIIIFIVLLTFIIFALCHPTFSVDLLTFFLEWIENNPWDGSVALIIAYIICNVLMIPGFILSLGSGIIYTRAVGFWSGICFASGILTIACFFGSNLAFLNARFLLRNAVVYLIRNHEKFKLIDRAVQKHGFKVVFLLRLSPVTPYSLMNYSMGFSSVLFRDYCLGAVGMIPNIFAYVYLGASINNIYEISTVNPKNSEFLLGITIGGCIILVITIFYFFWMARKELRRIAKQIRQESMHNLIDGLENAPLTMDSNTDDNDHQYDSNDDLL